MTEGKSIVIGSRGSTLARWQSEWVARRLRELHPGLTTEVRIISTKGDAILDAPLSKIGDKGLFTKELEHSLLEGNIDVAVHSLKDVPTAVPAGLSIAAITEREDIRDAFVSHPDMPRRRFSEVSKGASVATGSLRRKSQVLQARPDLTVVDIRGNVETRLQKLKASSWEGMFLAVAGLVRLGRNDVITEILSPSLMLPAVGQGALAVEIRSDDATVESLVRSLDHPPTRIAAKGERALLRRLEGGCQIPIGAYGRVDGRVFKLDALVGSLDGTRVVRSSIAGDPAQAEVLGETAANKLLAAGGKEILEEIVREFRRGGNG